MKALMVRDWTPVGICSLGMVFRSNKYPDSLVIEKKVRLVLEGHKDLYLFLTDEGVVVETNFHRISSPSELKNLNVSPELLQFTERRVALN